MISATMFRDSTKQELTEEQEQLKREIYERMNPRRRKFIDRIGYDEWDPFQKPNDPMDIRVDPSKRTTQQLFRGFMHSLGRGAAKAAPAMTSSSQLSFAGAGLGTEPNATSASTSSAYGIINS